MVRVSPTHSVPSYGVDAPGVVGAFLLVAGGLGTAAGLSIVAGHSVLLWLLGGLLGAGAIASLSLGISMLLYSAMGKHRLRDHLLRARAWRGDEIVLDIGAGRGLMAVGAAQRAPTGRVLALDLWSSRDLTGNTPDALRRNAEIERVASRIQVVTGDARRLEFDDDSVDVVTSVFCLHNIDAEPERLGACREIARVLKKRGTAMIADFPGTSGYVDTLRAAGLEVSGPHRAERIALGVAGYLIAMKA